MPSPCRGPVFAPGSPLLPPVPGPCLLASAVSALWSLSLWSHACSALCKGCSWRLAILVHQGLSLSASLPVALAAFIALGSQRTCCLFSLAVCALGCLMSRGDELRQLAAQLSGVGRARGLYRCGPLQSHGSRPVLVVLLPLPTLARLWLPLFRQRPQCPRRRLRPATRWRPLCCAPRLSGLPLHGLALAPALQHRCPNVLLVRRGAAPASLLAYAVQLLSRSRDWSRAWPPRVAHRSRLLSCGSHASLALFMPLPSSRNLPLSLLDPLRPPPRPPRLLVPRSLRPTPTTNGTLSP